MVRASVRNNCILFVKIGVIYDIVSSQRVVRSRNHVRIVADQLFLELSRFIDRGYDRHALHAPSQLITAIFLVYGLTGGLLYELLKVFLLQCLFHFLFLNQYLFGACLLNLEAQGLKNLLILLTQDICATFTLNFTHFV